MNATQLADLTLEIRKTTVIAAPQQIVWETMIEQITSGFADDRDNSLNMRLEPWPGGRYFRDLGNKTGHLWGHVQVIKPPKLLEITGPLFMSMPAINHVAYRLTPTGDTCELTITHRGFGWIDPEHRKGVDMGWQDELDRIKKAAEQRG
jgi:uncharacterized protein YndB with AHSA1/START domain